MRVPLYLRVTDRPIFAWYHAPDAGFRDEGVVICQPIGHEYISAHRSMRHLADRLASEGLPVLRFDYDGTGNSSGSDGEGDRVAAWLESIRQAMQALRDRSGCRRISLVGLRMGATLAALVAREVDVSSLVLWAPCVHGRSYVREMKALAATGARVHDGPSIPDLEAGGFVWSEATQSAVSAINLKMTFPRARRVLIASRDDLPENGALGESWSAAGLDVEQRTLPGYSDMLAAPHHTRVPSEAIATIVQWLVTGLPWHASSPTGGRDRGSEALSRTCVADGVRETILQFGRDDGTFGVLSHPARDISRETPTVIISNAGSTHHVGPGDLYVQLARALARAGVSSFRVDLPGLGDSVAGGTAENDPYPACASAVMDSAIDALGRHTGATSFVIMGICSGAHTALHAALDLPDQPIVEAVLINPLTFHYVPGMPLDPQGPEVRTPARRFREGIRRVALSSAPLQTVVDAATSVVRTIRRTRAEWRPWRRSRELDGQLRRLAAAGRKVTFVFSQFDPGHDLLMSEAGRAVQQLARQGGVRLFTIKHANHTFDASGPRGELIRSLVSHLTERYMQKPVPAASRIRLSNFAAQFGCGGTERQFLNLSLGLDAGRFDSEYGCMSRWGQLVTELQDRGIPVHEYPIRNLYGFTARYQQWRLARHLRRKGIQVVHAYNFYSNFFAIPAAWLAGVPVIIASIRDRGVYLTTAQRHAQRYVCKLADCVLVNAESIREWLVSDGYDPEKIVVIPNGIDLARFEAPRAAHIRHEFGWPDHAPVVAMVARLNPKKGVEDFIDAAALVTRAHPDARFLIVGEGQVSNHGAFHEDTPYLQSIQDRIARHGLVHTLCLTGYRSDVPALLAETTVSVLPSHSEGLSNTLLESMASGVPVVATRVGGTPEAIEDGVTGLLVPPADPPTLAAAIARVLSDDQLAARLGAAGRRRVHDRYAMERMVHATEQLYLDLLTQSAAGRGWRSGQQVEFRTLKG
jgi:glycosyltransferase involved in cell wall biosynthesis/pimeloyl-ACP methyl ester carboxylesterase